MTFGDALVKKQARMTYVALAAMVGTTKQAIWRIKSGDKLPGLRLARRIAKSLGVPLDVLTFPGERKK